jgi:hypothetical protein
MPRSRIETLSKTYPERNKTLFFILNRALINPATYNFWEHLVGREKTGKFEIDFEGVYLYSALRGYLTEQKIHCQPFGHLPIESMMRLEDMKDIEAVNNFLKRILASKRLHERGDLTIMEYGTLDNFKEYLKRLSSRYE